MIAPLVVWRRGDDDFLLLTEPELGETVRAHLTRMRFAAKCEIEPEEHTSTIVFGGGGRDPDRRLRRAGRRGARRRASRPTLADDELERLRILARTPRWGREIDDGDPARPRPASTSAPSRSRRAATRARSRSRACTTAATSTGRSACSSSTASRPRRATRSRRRATRRRARHELGAAGSRSPTSASMSRTTPSSTWPAARRGYTDRPRARSSGDRALPCGGRGRKFESCRAHFPSRIHPSLRSGYDDSFGNPSKSACESRPPCRARLRGCINERPDPVRRFYSLSSGLRRRRSGIQPAIRGSAAPFRVREGLWHTARMGFLKVLLRSCSLSCRCSVGHRRSSAEVEEDRGARSIRSSARSSRLMGCSEHPRAASQAVRRSA